VLHDWPDEKAIEIMKNIRKVISDNGLVVIVDFLITNQDNLGKYAKMDDTKMMIGLDGQNRSLDQFEEVFRQSGFRLKKIKFDSERHSILYCVPE
jgi:hypothetical protein